MAMIVPHHITCILHDISISIVGFGDQARCAEWIPLQTIRNELSALQQKFHLITMHQMMDYISTAYPSLLFEFFALFATLLLVILTLENDAILVAYQINTC